MTKKSMKEGKDQKTTPTCFKGLYTNIYTYFFSFGATAPIWALACRHETLRFTSVY
jgi:hypothetical protein